MSVRPIQNSLDCSGCLRLERTTRNVSDENIFTRAEKLGATAAVLYSLDSQTCYIALEDPSQIDIYTLSSLTTPNVIEGIFGHIDAVHHGTFDAASLDADFAEIVLAQLKAQTRYLIADLILDVTGSSGAAPTSSITGRLKGKSFPLSGPFTSSIAASSGSGVGPSLTATSDPGIASSSTVGANNSGTRLDTMLLSGTLCLWFYTLLVV
ncbi:hypothetical protein BV20DRAFT_1052519 [Pilatotrama ljubarskyi]|nr:hypothetical protein BV20DRAFT_1052519 [Pilatotrama ljubarskyi]